MTICEFNTSLGDKFKFTIDRRNELFYDNLLTGSLKIFL